LHAVLRHPGCLGLGLSEETGLLIRPGQPAVVFGDGVVVAVDARELTHSNVASVAPKASVSGHGLRLHLLAAGEHLDLASRTAQEG
jgi:cyanophycinase